MNDTIMSNARYSADRSQKECVCGGHNGRNYKSQSKSHRTALRKQQRRFAEAGKIATDISERAEREQREFFEEQAWSDSVLT